MKIRNYALNRTEIPTHAIGDGSPSWDWYVAFEAFLTNHGISVLPDEIHVFTIEGWLVTFIIGQSGNHMLVFHD